jgi:DNA integrity scanning protein DisA with diadenylate cyclase activity/mannitol/fructose-specific phosphotransferase system IIA component (Ntr-type)
MQLDRYISEDRILDLEGQDLSSVLVELLDSVCAKNQKLSKRSLLKDLINRENAMTTYLGRGAILPHIRVNIFAVGRSREGFDYDGSSETQKVHLVVVLLASEKERNYLQALASIARMFRDDGFVDRLIKAPTYKRFSSELLSGFSGVQSRLSSEQNKTNRLLFRQAQALAIGAEASTILFFADTMIGGVDVIPDFGDIPSVVISSRMIDSPVLAKDTPTLHIQAFSNKRFSQLRSAALIGLGRGLFNFTDKICCVGGIADSNQFDSVVIIDIQKEFRSVLSNKGSILPSNVKPEVLERVIAIATELTVEGREGQKVGTLFVIGDSEKVVALTKPLVLNPFYGYKHEDRNILNPFMDETIKEFSSIDGAFIIRGDGVILSAGSLIHVPDYDHKLPSGLGARHAAAFAISLATQCVSIVISSSTGQVTLFRRGVMLPLIEKGISGGF